MNGVSSEFFIIANIWSCIAYTRISRAFTCEEANGELNMRRKTASVLHGHILQVLPLLSHSET
jgi:hypothetical protein